MSEAIPGEPSVLAYTDRITYRQGETIELKADGQGLVEIDMVRLHHPPDDPSWSTPAFTSVRTVPSQRVELSPQETFAGSYLHASGLPLPGGEAVSGSVYVLPTLLDAGHVQGVISLGGSSGPAGVALIVDAGAPVLVWTDETGTERRLGSPVALIQGLWQVLSFSIDPVAGRASLAQRLVERAPGGIGAWNGSAGIEGFAVPRLSEVLVGAARLASVRPASLPGAPGAGTSFNGKIDSPVLSASAISTSALDLVTPEDLRANRAVAAAWDLSQEQPTSRAIDVGGSGCHGVLVNKPARAMTGVHWQGDEQNWVHAPEQYSAVHFHDDDLDDARWTSAAAIPIPEDLPTGVYGLRITEQAPAHEDDEAEMVTVVVVPARRRADARTLVVLPTYTYIAYANLLGNGEQIDYVAAGLAEGDAPPHSGQDRLGLYPEIGGALYDVHSDGTGRCYSTPRRPVLNLRMDWKSSRRDAYRHMAADLYIMEWLESLGVPYEVVTDHVLNSEGTAALEGYSTVLTGSHPEYISRQIIDTMNAFLDGGGSLLYLGGNGFYWVTTESTETPELLEVRRGFTGTRTWTGKAGESHHSMTGELGGLWRHRGLPPNKLLGVGFAAQGADGGAAGYRRAPGALEGPGAFLFEGTTSDVFGTTGYDMGGAAGDEVDRYAVELGSAPWGTVVGSSLELSRFYKLAIEDIQMTRENTGGDHEKDVRSDLVLTEHAAGGFVFSVGSISWVQSMAIGEFDNDVARITGNALKAALARSGAEEVRDPSQG